MQTIEELRAHYKPVKARLNAGPKKELVVTIPRLLTKGERILMEVAAKHEIKLIDLKSHSCRRKISAARWECMYRLRTELNLSLSSIGKFMNKDHTSVLYGIRKYEKTHLQEVG